jgi:hypothetical protein
MLQIPIFVAQMMTCYPWERNAMKRSRRSDEQIIQLL